jgi:hypothetical protein
VILCVILLALLPAVPGAVTARERVLVAFGDSLTAGYGLTRGEAYPALLETRMAAAGFGYRVVNAGVSGDTTAGGLRRVDWALKLQPEVVIVALGANDGLRGLDPAAVRVNLDRIVERFQAAGAKVLLAGMRLPPNYRGRYADDFERVFRSVAQRREVPLIARFALPAVLANVATPVSNAFVTMTIAGFSDAAVAAWAVIGRITPVAFGAIFALSGAVGPIIGQNLGAKSFARVRLALTEALRAAVYFTAAAWVALALAAPALVSLFGASGEAAELITFYCRWVAPLFVFFGTLFVSNAACNTLGRPHYATLLNWGRATLGTLPFTALGATWAGAKGVLIGYMAGGIVFGLIAVAVVFRLIARLEKADSAESRRTNQWSWF